MHSPRLKCWLARADVLHYPRSAAQEKFEHSPITSTDVVGNTTVSRERFPWSGPVFHWHFPAEERVRRSNPGMAVHGSMWGSPRRWPAGGCRHSWPESAPPNRQEAFQLLARWARAWASPNTVQLGARCPWNTGPRWTGRLRPRLVPVPLHVPLDVLALDDSRVAAMATGRIEPPREQRDGVSPAVVSGLRGKNRAPLRSSGERCGVRRRS